MCCSVPVKSWSRTSSRKRRFCHRKRVVWDIFWWFKGWGTWYQIFGTNISIDWISRKLTVQNLLCTPRRVDWTYIALPARLSVFPVRTESLVHGLPFGVTVQRLPCTSRQVWWTYRIYFARSGMLWCPPSPRKRSPFVRGRRVSCLEITCWIQGRFFV